MDIIQVNPMNQFGAALWPALAVIVTMFIALVQVVFKTGHLSARVEALEQWRGLVRGDMHEVSESLQTLTSEVKQLRTIIEERTDRRIVSRSDT
jgi:hypothetical protein